MLRLKLTKWLLGMAVVAGTVALGAGRADAHFHHHGGYGSCGSSGGSWGSYGSYGSSGYAVSCYSSGGSWGSSGGSWGSSGGSWGSSGGSWGGGYYSAPSYSAPATAPAPPSAPMAPSVPTPPPPAGGPPGTTYYQDAGYLLVSVPADAKVYVNGRATTSIGGDRQYVSRGLENGQRYSYEVRAEVVRDGKTVTETKVAQLTAGSQASLMFSLAAPASTASSAKPPRTALQCD